MPPNDETFRANSAERLFPDRSNLSLSAAKRVLALLGACVIYAALAAPLAIEYGFSSAPAPEEQEIPIEIVTEPPPAPEQVKSPPPAPEQPVEEPPATDAPREANNVKSDHEGEDKTPPPPPTPAETPGAAETAAPQLAAKEDSAPPDDKPAAEAPPAPVLNGDTPPPQQARAEPQATAEPPAQPAGAHAPLFESAPDIDFGAAIATQVAGGKARATYLTVLYGMIVPRLKKVVGPRSKTGRYAGAVVFSVDAKGRLVQRWIAQESGSRELDAAAYDAVGAASPFPPPPRGVAMAIRFTYGSD